MKELISIIILTYNNCEYLSQCLNSVYNQTYNNIEVIISDDASNEYNKKILSEEVKNNKWNKFFKLTLLQSEYNVGVVKNYNKALINTNGQYIFYLAVDDVLYDNKVIEDVVDYFVETKELIFTGYKDVYDECLNKYIKTLPRENEVEIIKKNDPKILYEALCKGSFISGSNTPFSRKLIEEQGLLDERYFYLEDYPRYLKLAKKGINIGFFERKLIKYRSGGITTSGTINDKLREDLFNVTVNECGEYFKEKWNDNFLINKKIIGWGTGDCFINSIDMLPFKIDYLIDSNKSYHGKYVQGIKIESPERLLFEDKENIFILIFSYANYFDICSEIEKIGYKEYGNYFCCTPNILKIIYSRE